LSNRLPLTDIAYKQRGRKNIPRAGSFQIELPY
jgi:hypothetical protein